MNLIESESNNINTFEELRYNSRGQKYKNDRHCITELIIEKRESKEEDDGEENVETN